LLRSARRVKDLDPDEPRYKFKATKEREFVIRDDKRFKLPRRAHVVVMDHQAEFRAHLDGTKHIRDREIGNGNVYYQRGIKRWNKRDMIRADSLFHLGVLMVLPEESFARVAAEYAGKSYPSGAAHPS
jgi:hypothetical protein